MSVKLYYDQVSSGAANYIAAHIGGLQFDGIEVDREEHKIKATGEDYYAINPKGNVPFMELPDGTKLAENTATLAYIAKHSPKDVGPRDGNDFLKLLNALGFITSELHSAGLGVFFGPSLTENGKVRAKENAKAKIQKFVKVFLDNGKRKYILDRLTVADIYAYIILSWAPYVNVERSPEAQRYYDNIRELPEIRDAHKKLANA